MMDADVDVDINVRLVNFLPNGIHEQVIRNHDDSYTILIDAKQSWENQRKSYEHAIGHILNGDFDGVKDVQEIEMIAHSYSPTTIQPPIISSDEFEKMVQRRLRVIKRRRKMTAKKLRDYYKMKELLMIN